MVEGELSIAIATDIFQNIDAILITKGESSKGHLPALYMFILGHNHQITAVMLLPKIN